MNISKPIYTNLPKLGPPRKIHFISVHFVPLHFKQLERK